MQWGLRFLQASLLLPLHRKQKAPARAVPIRFVAAPSLKKPGAKVSPEEQQRYRARRKQYNLSQQAVGCALERYSSRTQGRLILESNAFQNGPRLAVEIAR
jgi:hypothetical protein